MNLSGSEGELVRGCGGDMSGDVIRWWSMWSYTMASGRENAADRSMKAMSWKVVDVVVFTIGGDARDVVTVGIESDLMGSICSCDIRSGANESMTICIISIIIIIVANIIIMGFAVSAT